MKQKAKRAKIYSRQSRWVSGISTKKGLSAVDVTSHKGQGRPTCHIRLVRQTRHHSLQGKLREYLGATFDDHTLPLYIAVMLNHGNGQAQVAENLVEFLQEEPASSFSAW